MMRFIVLFILVISLSFAKSSVYRQGDYVFDTKHNLLWQDTPENTTILKSQADAKKYCEDLVLGKFSSWRLPNRDEYRTIIDMNRKADELTIRRAFNMYYQTIIGRRIEHGVTFLDGDITCILKVERFIMKIKHIQNMYDVFMVTKVYNG